MEHNVDIYPQGRRGPRHQLTYNGTLEEALQYERELRKGFGRENKPHNRTVNEIAEDCNMIGSKIKGLRISVTPFLVLWLLLVTTFPAHADEWTKQDIILESTWQILQFVDWKQTREIAKHPELYEEKNPIFGSHPSTGKVDALFAAGALLHVGITHVLPQEYRVYWQAVTIGMSAVCVINNYSIGIRVGF